LLNNLCDGSLSLLDNARITNVDIFELNNIIDILVDNNILETYSL